jgi:Las17-binding protein actin regulator
VPCNRQRLGKEALTGLCPGSPRRSSAEGREGLRQSRLFVGVSLEGSSLRPDNEANESLYGKKVSARDIVLEGAVPSPASAQKLLATLNQSSPKEQAQK